MSGGLVWAPDPREARQVRARWVGAPALHTIYWGDGSSDRVLPWQGARQHVYAEPGRYEATAVAATAATAATVVVRPGADLVVRAELAAPNRVRLTLPDLLEPDWLIEWGDGTATRHANTTAEHTYPWGHGLTRITVTDRPGRRRARLTGPTIGAEPEPDPEPEPDAGLLRDGFWWEHVGGRDGVLHGGGITPCSEVDIWWSAGASGSGHQVVTAVARQVPDDDGQAHRLPEALPVPRFHVGALNDGWYGGWFEVRNPHDEPAPFGLVFELAAPAVLAEVDSWGGTASAHPLGPGRWRIDHDRPVPPRGSVRVGITVRPCGDPRRWPTNVQVVQ